MNNENKIIAAVFILAIIVYIISLITKAITAHPYLSALIGLPILAGLCILAYYSFKREDLREAEKGFFSSLWEKIIGLTKSMTSEERERKERIPIPAKTKAFVLERAEYKCQLCANSVHPEIHHIDKNPSNNSPSNLIVLCPTHHAEADGGSRRKEQLYAARDKSAHVKKLGYS